MWCFKKLKTYKRKNFTVTYILWEGEQYVIYN